MCRSCPKAPTDVATDVGLSSSTTWAATWTDGTPSGIPEETYTLKCVPKDSQDGCNTITDDQTTGISAGVEQGVVTGLANSTEYDCYVVAVNAAGYKCSSKVAYKTSSCSCPLTSSGNDFSAFNLGSINEQFNWTTNDGFTCGRITSTWDEEIMEFNGTKVWRISNANGTYGFSSSPFSSEPDMVAGETGSYLYNDRGTGGNVNCNPPGPIEPPLEGAAAETKCFCAGFDIRSTTGAPQPNLHVEVSAASKQSAYRQSYFRIYDNEVDGFDIKFVDEVAFSETYSESVNTFVNSSVSGLDYTNWHRITISVEFVDGINQDTQDIITGNDIAKVFVDGTLVWAGSTWEPLYYTDTYRFIPAERRLQAVNSVLFRFEKPSISTVYLNGFYVNDFDISN